MRRAFLICTLAIGMTGAAPLCADERPGGREIYERHCAACHGAQGEGTPEHYPAALAGDRSAAQLARFIAKSMPPDMPGALSETDSQLAATYIYDAFTSPEAQVRRQPPRIELARLTARQYESAVADLMVAFFGPPPADAERGLRGNYATINANGDGKQVISRLDGEVKFDFGASSPDPQQIDPAEFAISWTGALHAPATGEYEFIVRSPNSFKLFVNNRRTALIDAWVKSGDQTDYRGAVRLLAGRKYLVQLYFTKAGQGVKKPEQLRARIAPAAISLAWKPPGGAEETIPARRLSSREVRETLIVEAPFPPDDRSTGFERGTSVSPEWDQAATNAAAEAASYVRERLGDYTGVVEPEPQHEPALREFCGRFVERAFRRPLSPELRSLYVDRQFQQAPELATAVERVVLMTLKSPRFLYVDLPGDAADGYAVASRLSFALWDSLPDDALLAAAAAGQLATREQAAAHAQRMTSDPRFHAKLREFILQWLRIDQLRELHKEAEQFPEFNAEFAADLRTSLELFLEEVLTDERADFRQLLLAEELYLNGRLARVYKAELPGDAPFTKARVDGSQRAGVLTHPYLMAAFAETSASSPIRRGVFVARSLLGRTLRPPPDAVTPIAPSLHPGLTTRERTSLQTSAQACQSCHALINPLGFPLERFDALGRVRTTENDNPVDASGEYLSRGGETVKFDGARELAEFLANSDEVHAAFVEKLFYYLVKQPIRAFGGDALPSLHRQFVAHDFNIRRLAADIAVRAALPKAEEAPASTSPPGK